MQILSENEIIVPHSQRLITIDDVQKLGQASAKMGTLSYNFVYQPQLIRQLETTLKYGYLVDLTNLFLLRYTDQGITAELFVGNVPLCFAVYNQNNNSAVWHSLCQLGNSASAVVDPYNMTMQFLDENQLVAAGLPNRKPTLLNDRALCDHFQTFYSNVPLTNNINRQMISVDIPVNQKLSEQFNHPENAQEFSRYVENNADIILTSQFNPGTIQLTSTPIPLGDTVKAELFTTTTLNQTPNFQVKIQEGGKQIDVGNYTDQGFNLQGLRFTLMETNFHDVISFIQKNGNHIMMGELKPFNDGHSEKTAGDITPYLLTGNWTCLYWPDSRFIANSDGTMGTSFDDRIYLFRD